jgi:hypothetical protein
MVLRFHSVGTRERQETLLFPGCPLPAGALRGDMSGEAWSFAVQIWWDPGGGCIQVVSVDEARAVHLRTSSYLLRVAVDNEHAMSRCLLRHIGSGREVYFQGGLGLQSFIEACLVTEPVPDQASAEEARG